MSQISDKLAVAVQAYLCQLHYSARASIFGCPATSLKAKLGPLHTLAKSRDHEGVRAHKKVSEGRPNTPPNIM